MENSSLFCEGFLRISKLVPFLYHDETRITPSVTGGEDTGFFLMLSLKKQTNDQQQQNQ